MVTCKALLWSWPRLCEGPSTPVHISAWTLWSLDEDLLRISLAGTFSVAEPQLWSSLPGQAHLASSLLLFWRLLKTVLFERAF